MPEVHVSSDHGHTWKQVDADPLKVLVLQPGSGMIETNRNPETFQKILTRYPRSVIVDFPGREAPTLFAPDFAYPEGFRQGEAEFKVDDEKKDLAWFSKAACKAAMAGDPPVALWCGSRGCQVSIQL